MAMPGLPLLKTDQVRCFDASGSRIPCGGTGQDADGRVDGMPSADRFHPRDGVVEDRLTGLLWLREGSPATFPLFWEEAFSFISQMNREKHAGIENWRLPTRRELFSLISHQRIDPALPAGHPFQNVFSGYYWTADACSRLPEEAWYAHLGGGRVYRGMKHGSCMVWPTAGPPLEEAPPENRFIPRDLTAVDRFTRRMWLKPLGGIEGLVTWQEALDAVRRLNVEKVAGHADWRLPNIRELESLVDLHRHSPALSPDHPFGPLVHEGLWSSTTSLYEPRYAWVLYPRDGAVGVGFKALSEFGLWVVRCPKGGSLPDLH